MSDEFGGETVGVHRLGFGRSRIVYFDDDLFTTCMSKWLKVGTYCARTTNRNSDGRDADCVGVLEALIDGSDDHSWKLIIASSICVERFDSRRYWGLYYLGQHRLHSNLRSEYRAE
jgi:hypothetical protein